MRIKFWGVRGSISSSVRGESIRSKVQRILSLATPADLQSPDAIDSFLDSLSLSYWSTYGGNTTCIEIRDKKDNLVIIDGGTGIRELGNSILHEGFLEGKGKAKWIFTHTHWDHIQGVPFLFLFILPETYLSF